MSAVIFLNKNISQVWLWRFNRDDEKLSSDERPCEMFTFLSTKETKILQAKGNQRSNKSLWQWMEIYFSHAQI